MSTRKLAEVIENACSHNSYGGGAPAYVRGDLGRITAAIESAFVIIPRDELPGVTPTPGDPNTFRCDGQSIVYMSVENARDWVMRDVAVWQHMKLRDADRRAQLANRRNELAAELAGEGFSRTTYDDVPCVAKNAIDRIIDMEDGNQ